MTAGHLLPAIAITATWLAALLPSPGPAAIAATGTCLAGAVAAIRRATPPAAAASAIIASALTAQAAALVRTGAPTASAWGAAVLAALCAAAGQLHALARATAGQAVIIPTRDGVLAARPGPGRLAIARVRIDHYQRVTGERPDGASDLIGVRPEVRQGLRPHELAEYAAWRLTASGIRARVADPSATAILAACAAAGAAYMAASRATPAAIIPAAATAALMAICLDAAIRTARSAAQPARPDIPPSAEDTAQDVADWIITALEPSSTLAPTAPRH